MCLASSHPRIRRLGFSKKPMGARQPPGVEIHQKLGTYLPWLAFVITTFIRWGMGCRGKRILIIILTVQLR